MKKIHTIKYELISYIESINYSFGPDADFADWNNRKAIYNPAQYRLCCRVVDEICSFIETNYPEVTGIKDIRGFMLLNYLSDKKRSISDISQITKAVNYIFGCNIRPKDLRFIPKLAGNM